MGLSFVELVPACLVVLKGNQEENYNFGEGSPKKTYPPQTSAVSSCESETKGPKLPAAEARKPKPMVS